MSHLTVYVPNADYYKGDTVVEQKAKVTEA
jgi:hypothetical protein